MSEPVRSSVPYETHRSERFLAARMWIPASRTASPELNLGPVCPSPDDGPPTHRPMNRPRAAHRVRRTHAKKGRGRSCSRPFWSSAAPERAVLHSAVDVADQASRLSARADRASCLRLAASGRTEGGTGLSALPRCRWRRTSKRYSTARITDCSGYRSRGSGGW
jgi:hypothetical protein